MSDDFFAPIEKKYGKGAIMYMGKSPNIEVDVISTNSIILDKLLGVGGMPRARIAEIFGWEMSGKTTLCLNLICAAQKQGLKCAFIDSEYALDINYAKKIGVDIDKLLISQPDCGEESLDIADILINSGEVGLIIIDSVAALTPRAEIEGEIGDVNIALQARMMSQALRKLRGAIQKNKVCVVFTNQQRNKIMTGGFGSNKTTTGGRALAFYASVRIELAKVQTIKNKDEVVGSKIKAKIIKNKVSPPFKVGYFEIYENGICPYSEIIELATAEKIIIKKGAWYSYEEETNIAQGKEQLKDLLKEKPEMFEEIKKKVKESIK